MIPKCWWRSRGAANRSGRGAAPVGISAAAADRIRESLAVAGCASSSPRKAIATMLAPVLADTGVTLLTLEQLTTRTAPTQHRVAGPDTDARRAIYIGQHVRSQGRAPHARNVIGVDQRYGPGAELRSAEETLASGFPSSRHGVYSPPDRHLGRTRLVSAPTAFIKSRSAGSRNLRTPINVCPLPNFAFDALLREVHRRRSPIPT